MTFGRHDRVRLREEFDRIPAGTEGIVLGRHTPDSVYLVQFANWGVREIPDALLERVEATS